MTIDLTKFEAFPKIKRLFKDPIIVTEKIDGTNAQILISEDGIIQAGSRNKFVTVGDDNYGFASWVREHESELIDLGPGRHFGEWWGKGIQRGYDLTEKRFSLFNTERWGGHSPPPSCCHVVPVLGCHTFDSVWIKEQLEELKRTGSRASPGFMDIEGIVCFHIASQQLFKFTVDDNHKGN